MANEIATHTDNTAGAARFARSIIGWFPDADPPEDWTKQVVVCAKRFSDHVLAAAHKALREQGLRRLPSVPQIEVAIQAASAARMEAIRISTLRRRPSPAELRERGRELLDRLCRRHEAVIRGYVADGWGGVIWDILSTEAWHCAQKECEIAWPGELIEKRIKTAAPGARTLGPLGGPITFGLMANEIEACFRHYVANAPAVGADR